MYHVVSGDPPLPSTSEVSSGCMQFIKRCLSRQPADRPGAAELLQDPWLADTLKGLEREVHHNQQQQQPSRLVLDPPDGVSNLGLLPTGGAADQRYADEMMHMHRANNPMDPMLGANSRDGAHMHSYSSVGSVGSASNPANRSRASSVSRKNLAGDLRFMPLGAADTTNPETMFSLIDHRSIGGSYSSGERSPGAGGSGLHGTLGGLRNPMSSIGMSPLARTPGSPGSTNSLHAAWPYNKDTTSGVGSSSVSISALAAAATTPTQTAPPLAPSASTGLLPWNPLSASGIDVSAVTSGIGTDGAIAAVVPNQSLRSAGMELAAIYSSPSAIKQAISGSGSTSTVAPSRLQNAIIMDSPVDSVATPSELHQFSTNPAANSSVPVSANAADTEDKDAVAQESFPVAPTGASASAPVLSNDEIQDLSDTTRNVVTAMLSMPLEGVDVAGVAGWLGEGNTPMELLDAQEIQETVATTSHIVVRQREQQIRQQQVMRNFMNHQKSQENGGTLKDKEPSGVALDTVGGGQSRIIRKGVVIEQRIEPPAVFPLPPDDTEDEEYDDEDVGDAEDEYESDA
ncbi:Suppressor of Sensor Kinase (SLN1) [Coemansia sp. RSA 1933]|nr:Suppressor of Sensor Kinase (SLN1) [Coemansia sp. RSA 1933]